MCNVEGCEKPVRARGMCVMHWSRWKRNGDPNVTKHTMHGKRNSSVYNCWLSMIDRCENKDNDAYANYGGRGIKVCERWKDINNFIADMGERPEGLTIERIDVNGDYEPSNCCWASRKEQMRNTRRTRFDESDIKSIRSKWAGGMKQKDIAAEYGVNPAYISQIVNNRIWQ